MVIKINIHNEIVWPLVLLFFMQYFGMSGELLFAVSVIWLIYLSIKNNHMTLMVPNVNGLKLYLIFIIVATFIGIMSNHARDVTKDIYYSVPAVVMIMIGYLYNRNEKGRSITKTLYLIGTIISIFSFIELILNISLITDMSSIRMIMGKSIYEIVIIMGMMFAEKIIGRKVIFSKKTDWLIFFVMIMKCITSLGRTELISTMVIITIILLLNIWFSENKFKPAVSILEIITGITVLGMVVLFAIPDTAKTQFFDKMNASMEEVNSNNEYDSTTDAMQHWRGYEIECASEQWKQSNILVELVGGGFGTYIKIHYIPHNFTKGMVINSSISLLHNSYYTLLVKGGLLGIGALIWLYLSNILTVFNKKYRTHKTEVCILCSITIGIAIMTYVVRGIFSQTMFISWGIMVGWINAEIKRVKK